MKNKIFLIMTITLVLATVACGGGDGGNPLLPGGDGENPLLPGGDGENPLLPGGDPNPGDVISSSFDPSIKLSWIPAGSFTMGYVSGSDGDPALTDASSHTVELTSGFYMAHTEVTQAQWSKVMTGSENNANPSYNSGHPNHPVEQITWYDAVEFCNILSKKDNRTPVYEITTISRSGGTTGMITNATVTPYFSNDGYRLPTEAEWEYACRANGNPRTAFHFGNAIDNSFAVYVPDPIADVKSKNKPNAWGLHDMHGNVWEWCWDWYAIYPGGLQTDPRGATSGIGRVMRGGSWYHAGQYLRSAYRVYYHPYDGNYTFGFRVVRPEK